MRVSGVTAQQVSRANRWPGFRFNGSALDLVVEVVCLPLTTTECRRPQSLFSVSSLRPGVELTQSGEQLGRWAKRGQTAGRRVAVGSCLRLSCSTITTDDRL